MKIQLRARRQTQRESALQLHEKQREKSKEYQEKMRRKHAEIVKYHERNSQKSNDSKNSDSSGDSSGDEDFMEKLQKMREMMWQKKSGASFHDHKNEEEDDPNGTWRDVESPRTKKARPGKKAEQKDADNLRLHPFLNLLHPIGQFQPLHLEFAPFRKFGNDIPHILFRDIRPIVHYPNRQPFKQRIQRRRLDNRYTS
jgi:hypothetical protein